MLLGLNFNCLDSQRVKTSIFLLSVKLFTQKYCFIFARWKPVVIYIQTYFQLSPLLTPKMWESNRCSSPHSKLKATVKPNATWVNSKLQLKPRKLPCLLPIVRLSSTLTPLKRRVQKRSKESGLLQNQMDVILLWGK